MDCVRLGGNRKIPKLLTSEMTIYKQKNINLLFSIALTASIALLVSSCAESEEDTKNASIDTSSSSDDSLDNSSSSGTTSIPINTGNGHSCAILDNGSVKCWGYNNYGQLGIDNTTNMGDNSSEMTLLTGVNLGTGRTATAIAGGHGHTCALLDNSSVKCWGKNSEGQLGIDNSTDMGKTTGSMALIPSIDL